MVEQTLISRDDIILAGQAIQRSHRIAVISPKNLDGDSLGACSALFRVFKSLGKEAVLMCVAEIPDNLRCIPHTNEYLKELDTSQFDLFIVPDTADPKLTGMIQSHPELFDGSKELINIDHHVSNMRWGTINLVDPNYASATMVVFKLLRAWNVEIDPDTATALLTGLYTDTGSLMHSNTTPLAYEIAGKLMSAGADHKKIVKTVFNNLPIATMKLWGRVMERAHQNTAKITSSYVTSADFTELNQNPDHLSGVVDYLNAVPGNLFSALISEYKGKVKGSLRALRDDVDVNVVAKRFGGGGHPKAAGFTIEGRLVVSPSFAEAPAGRSESLVGSFDTGKQDAESFASAATNFPNPF